MQANVKKQKQKRDFEVELKEGAIDAANLGSARWDPRDSEHAILDNHPCGPVHSVSTLPRILGLVIYLIYVLESCSLSLWVRVQILCFSQMSIVHV